MKTTTRILSGVMMLTVAATAGGPRNAKENSGQDRRIMYMEMITKSKQEVSSISSAVEGLLKVVTEAKDSGDKTKMKSALDASAKHLVEMKERAANCMKHMESLETSVSQE